MQVPVWERKEKVELGCKTVLSDLTFVAAGPTSRMLITLQKMTKYETLLNNFPNIISNFAPSVAEILYF